MSDMAGGLGSNNCAICSSNVVNSPGIWLRYFSSVLVSVKRTKFDEVLKKARALFVD